MLEIEFLGTGTSTGVPQLLCGCDVCRSQDAHDKRLRCSAIVRYCGKNILIDCGPDFRSQMLRASDKSLDALIITHIHYDHVGGIDDLRAYCAGREFPVFAQADVIDGLRQRLPYCFAEHPYPGVPRLSFSEIKANVPFSIGDVEITPIPVMHYKLPILGFRIGPLAYITDAKTIDTEQLGTLKGIPLLVINSLRIEPHMSHYCLRETLDVIDQIKPQRALLTHMSHEMGLHAQVNRILPPGVELAHDTLTVSIED